MDIMEEIECCDCGVHLGWIIGNAPRGFIYCDQCADDMIREEENEMA